MHVCQPGTAAKNAQDNQAAKQLGIDLAQQLSRQTADAWTPEAARTLYDAAKFIKSKAGDARSIPEGACLFGIALYHGRGFLRYRSKKKTMTGKDSLFKAWRAQQNVKNTEDLLSLLLIRSGPDLPDSLRFSKFRGNAGA
jgi:hypothetical protein